MPGNFTLFNTQPFSKYINYTKETFLPLSINERCVLLGEAVFNLDAFNHLIGLFDIEDDRLASIHYANDAVFLLAATKDRIQVVNQMLKLTKNNEKMIHADKSTVFKYVIPSCAPHILPKEIKERAHAIMDGSEAVLQYPKAAIFLALVLPSKGLPSFDATTQEIILKLQDLKAILLAQYLSKGKPSKFEPSHLLSKLFEEQFNLLIDIIDTSTIRRAMDAKGFTRERQLNQLLSSISLDKDQSVFLREAMNSFFIKLQTSKYEVMMDDLPLYGSCCFR